MKGDTDVELGRKDRRKENGGSKANRGRKNGEGSKESEARKNIGRLWKVEERR